MGFSVLPAIDLSDGSVVRLVQGERQREIRYPEAPGEVAERFLESGASWLHVVNLDGAFDQPDDPNRTGLRSILRTGARVQYGGGLRDVEAIGRALELGVGRVVVGTLAVEQPHQLTAAIRQFGANRILAAVDSRGGQLQSHGWTRDAPTPLVEYAHQLAALGIKRIIYTSADRDGTGRGLDLETAARIQETTGLETLVSGGVGRLADIRAARSMGLAGVIVGRALHDGRMSLEEALQC